MEAFESFVALTMEDEGFVVSEAVKFPVTVPVPSREGEQTHGFEVDLVGARADRLVLASVKSFFGSRGVVADHVMGLGGQALNRRYALLNNPVVRDGVIARACERFGYDREQAEVRLYVGKFAGDKRGDHATRIRSWCAEQTAGGGPIRVLGLREIAEQARRVANSKTYRDNPALVAIKVLDAAGMLRPVELEEATGGCLRG